MQKKGGDMGRVEEKRKEEREDCFNKNSDKRANTENHINYVDYVHIL